MNRLLRYVDRIDPDLSVQLLLLRMRRDEALGRRLARALALRGTAVVDIGASRGVYLHVLAKQVGATGHVFAVEPVPQMHARLRTLARRRGNVSLHPVALSDHDGAMSLAIPVHEGRRIDTLASLEAAKTVDCISLDVPVTTLDELVAGSTDQITFVKCDVEGHEQRVLDGATDVLEQGRAAFLIEIEQRHRGTPVAETFDFFAGHGYAGFFLSDEGLHPLSEFDLQRDQLSYLTGEFSPAGYPRTYRNDFLFLPPSRLDEIAELRAPAGDIAAVGSEAHEARR